MSSLPFLHLFNQLQKDLRYRMSMSKYMLWLEALEKGGFVGEQGHDLSALCKALLLQDHRDEQKFFRILEEALEREVMLLVQAAEPDTSAIGMQTDTKPANPSSEPTRSKSDHNPGPQKKDDDSAHEAPTGSKKEMYFNPPFQSTSPSPEPPNAPRNFLQTDEYFSISRRDMIKAWQTLRYHEKSGMQDKIDLPNTTRMIARDGYFSKPVYYPGVANRNDALMIFADYRGSMTPFHELTDRLITTATSDGGHPDASTWFFQNFPTGYVFAKSNLSGPVPLKQALAKANRNFTIAIVISDAGAARGNTDTMQARVMATKEFAAALNAVCAHVIWLNPMPTHRWKGTAAEAIAKMVFLMAPILESSNYSLQDTLRTVLKQNITQK